MSDGLSETIEAYLDGSIDEIAAGALLARCRADPQLATQLAAHRGLVSALQASDGVQAERTWSSLAHALAYSTPSKRQRIADAIERRLPRERRAARVVRGPWWLVAAAAAVLALASLPLVLSDDTGPRPDGTTPPPGLVAGEVWLERDGQRLARRQWGDLRPGDRLRVADDARVVLPVDELTQLDLSGPADLRIGALAPQRRWRLERGRLQLYFLPRHAPGEQMLVTTPHARYALVGTCLKILAEPECSELQVVSGQIELESPGVEATTVGPGVRVQSWAERTLANPVIGSAAVAEGLVRFFPAAEARYALGEYVIPAELPAGHRLWGREPVAAHHPQVYRQRAAAARPLSQPPGAIEFVNPAGEQRYAELVTGSCALAAFAITYRARVQRFAGPPMVANEAPGGFHPPDLRIPPLRIAALPAVRPDSHDFSEALLHRLSYLHVGYDYATRQPVYEVMVEVAGRVVGRGFARGQPDRLQIALVHARLRVESIAIEALELPALR